MAVLHRKEEKIQAVLGRLPKKYNSDDFVAMFIKLYSKDWGKIKSAYIKASQDKEPGTVIHMPKPELYLKQILEIFLSQQAETTNEAAITEAPVTKVKASAKKLDEAAPVKKTKAITAEKPAVKVVKSKVSVKKIEEAPTVSPVKKSKATPKKKAE
jgi:hypothetical protein